MQLIFFLESFQDKKRHLMLIFQSVIYENVLFSV